MAPSGRRLIQLGCLLGPQVAWASAGTPFPSSSSEPLFVVDDSATDGSSKTTSSSSSSSSSPFSSPSSSSSSSSSLPLSTTAAGDVSDALSASVTTSTSPTFSPSTSSSITRNSLQTQALAQARQAFEEFKIRYDKQYSASEEAYRFQNFLDNLKRVEDHNNGQEMAFSLEMNVFADLSPEEFSGQYLAEGGSLVESTSNHSQADMLFLGEHQFSGASLPDRVDWREQGAVTNVKNQGQCGSCYTFASAGAIEGAWKIGTGTLVSLSEQQLLDCSSTSHYHNNGCSGGSIQMTLYYATTQGVCNFGSYPYQTRVGSCQASSCRVVVPHFGVKGYKQIRQGDEESMLEAVSMQPLAVAVDAKGAAWQLYSSGVFGAACGTLVNHAVLIVGYGKDNGLDYWLVKNSWGPTWGESGYIRMRRGQSPLGQCAINISPVYAVIDPSREKPLDYMPSVIAGAVVAALALATCLYCVLRRRCRRNSPEPRAPLLATDAWANPGAPRVVPSAPPAPAAGAAGHRLGGAGTSRLVV